MPIDDREKILGVDFGERRIGLAISEGSLSSPLKIIGVENQQAAIKEIVALCQKERVGKIVLGLPEGPLVGKVKIFGQKLANLLKIKMIYWNEALTTDEALRKMIASGRGRKDRRRLDDISAAIILQEYLDSQCRKEN